MVRCELSGEANSIFAIALPSTPSLATTYPVFMALSPLQEGLLQLLSSSSLPTKLLHYCFCFLQFLRGQQRLGSRGWGRGGRERRGRKGVREWEGGKEAGKEGGKVERGEGEREKKRRKAVRAPVKKTKWLL